MKKVKSIAFNLADHKEFQLYSHATQNGGLYFSTYIKRLIQKDIEEQKHTEFIGDENLFKSIKEQYDREQYDREQQNKEKNGD